MTHIRIIIILLLAVSASWRISAQGVLTSIGIDPENVCFQGSVYYGTAIRAVPLESVITIEKRLNETVTFARDYPNYYSEPAVRFAVNCRGELGGGFHMATSTGDDTFDALLIEFFQTIERWRPGEEPENMPVDTWCLWRMRISNGYIDILP